MIIKMRFEISDATRNKIACHLAGKPVKRLAQGQEIRPLFEAFAASLDADEVFEAVKTERKGGFVKCPSCAKVHETEADQSHICGCGQTFIAKRRGNI